MPLSVLYFCHPERRGRPWSGRQRSQETPTREGCVATSVPYRGPSTPRESAARTRVSLRMTAIEVYWRLRNCSRGLALETNTQICGETTRATGGWWLPSAKIVTKVQLPYLYFRNLDRAPFGSRLGVGAPRVLVSLNRPAERERGCNTLFDNLSRFAGVSAAGAHRRNPERSEGPKPFKRYIMR